MDPADPSLEFIEKKDNLRPLAIFRVDTEFLLCYDGTLQSGPDRSGYSTLPVEWAFFVDKHGFRARGDWKACWEGRPTAFGTSHLTITLHIPNLIFMQPSTTRTLSRSSQPLSRSGMSSLVPSSKLSLETIYAVSSPSPHRAEQCITPTHRCINRE